MRRTTRYVLACMIGGLAQGALAANLSRSFTLADGSQGHATIIVPDAEVERYEALGYQGDDRIATLGQATAFAEQICALAASPEVPADVMTQLYGVSASELCASAQAALAEWQG